MDFENTYDWINLKEFGENTWKKLSFSSYLISLFRVSKVQVNIDMLKVNKNLKYLTAI